MTADKTVNAATSDMDAFSSRASAVLPASQQTPMNSPPVDKVSHAGAVDKAVMVANDQIQIVLVPTKAHIIAGEESPIERSRRIFESCANLLGRDLCAEQIAQPCVDGSRPHIKDDGVQQLSADVGGRV